MPENAPITVRWAPGGPARSLLDISTMSAFSGVSPGVARPLPGVVAYTVRRLRKRAGLTQRELADRVGVCETTVRRWENGSRVPAAACVSRFRGSVPATASELEELLSSSGECASKRRRRRSVLLSLAASGMDHTYCGDVSESDLQGILGTYRRYGRYRARLHRARTYLARIGVLSSSRGPCGPVYRFSDGGRERMSSMDLPGYVSSFTDAELESGPRAPYGSRSGYRRLCLERGR